MIVLFSGVRRGKVSVEGADGQHRRKVKAGYREREVGSRAAEGQQEVGGKAAEGQQEVGGKATERQQDERGVLAGCRQEEGNTCFGQFFILFVRV